jgi:hypothetical protein
MQTQSLQYRMERAFFIRFIRLVNEVQGRRPFRSSYIPHRKTMWEPKNISNRAWKVS